MKPRLIYRTLFTLLLATTFSTIASAQVTWGLRLISGQNIIFWSAWGESNIYSATIVGIGGQVKIPLKETLALQPEINYTTYTADFIESNTLSIPILLTWKLNKLITLEAGPSLEKEFAFNSKRYYDHLTPSYNLGINRGISFNFNENWSANLRYSFEVFRTTYSNTPFGGGNDDPLLFPEHDGPEPGFRDTRLTASVQYSFR